MVETGCIVEQATRADSRARPDLGSWPRNSSVWQWFPRPAATSTTRAAASIDVPRCVSRTSRSPFAIPPTLACVSAMKLSPGVSRGLDEGGVEPRSRKRRTFGQREASLAAPETDV